MANRKSDTLDVFMDVALHAMIDLDARVASAVRYARTRRDTYAKGLWYAGVGLLREDPIVTEIVLHYLRDPRALDAFELCWELPVGDRRHVDLVLKENGGPNHYVEVKWWWWEKDRHKCADDLRRARAIAAADGHGYVLIVTAGNTPDEWRDELGRSPSDAAVEQWSRRELGKLLDQNVGQARARAFSTSVHHGEDARDHVGALILVPAR